MPFVIFALPRSRTAWLSHWLGRDRWLVGHDEIRHWRGIEDIRCWLSMPYSGTVETMAAPYWRLGLRLAPQLRVAVVRRPIDEVMDSIARAGMQFDPDVMRRHLCRLDAKLHQIARRWPNAIEIGYDSINLQADRLWSHCRAEPFDTEAQQWFGHCSGVNIQLPMEKFVRYAGAYAQRLELLSDACRQAILGHLGRRPVPSIGGIEIAAESPDDLIRDGKALFAEHSTSVGEEQSSFARKNLPLIRQLYADGKLMCLVARSNGKPFGYLLSLISPSLEGESIISAIHTAFYSSPSIPGLGLRLQREAIERERLAGVDEVWFRRGERNDPRQATLYRRVGATPAGDLFRLQLTGLE